MKTPLNGLAAPLCRALGTRWQKLHPDIRARFTLAPGATAQSFTGTMQEIDRSPVGWLIARLIAFVHVLPSARTRNVPFEFNLAPAPDVDGGWIKQRLYHFADGPFEFRSVMGIAENGRLIEQFPYGLGMNIQLGAEGEHGEKLYFRDDGYFLRIGRLRVPLPRWLGVGRFTLLHQNIDRENFRVEIHIDHPWFGRLFYQCGRFRESRRSFALNGVTAFRAETAREPARGTAHSRHPSCGCAPQ